MGSVKEQKSLKSFEFQVVSPEIYDFHDWIFSDQLSKLLVLSTILGSIVNWDT